MRPMLSVASLSGGYGALRVFEDLSLDLEANETLGLIGPNGAGKSTLLKTFAGLLPPSAGTIMVDGVDMTHMPAYLRARAGVVLVPEGRLIFSSLTVLDNLRLALTALVGRAERLHFDRFLSEVFDLFPRLADRRNQPGGSLSGGEQQMLAISRALLTQPQVLMLDEPTQGLAPIVIEDIINVLTRVRDRYTMLIVEQNRAFVERLAGRRLTMDSGRLHPSS